MARSSNGASGNFLSRASNGWPLNGSAGPFTMVFWIKSHDTSQTNRYLWNTYNAFDASSWALIYGFVSQKIEFFNPSGGGTDPRTGSDITISDTNWHHIAYRYNGAASTWDKFLDGTKTSINASITFTLPTLNPVTPAPKLSAFAFWNGSADSNGADVELQELAFLASALSDAQIGNLANGSVSLATLVASGDPYWPLCGVASPEPDLSSNGWDLTINGTVSQATGPAGIASPCSSGPVLTSGKIIFRNRDYV